MLPSAMLSPSLLGSFRVLFHFIYFFVVLFCSERNVFTVKHHYQMPDVIKVNLMIAGIFKSSSPRNSKWHTIHIASTSI